MSGPRNNHFDPHFKRDGNHWRSKSYKSANVCSSKDARKHLNAVYDFAKQYQYLDLLVKVTKAEIELTRIQLAEKLASFRKECVYRKR